MPQPASQDRRTLPARRYGAHWFRNDSAERFSEKMRLRKSAASEGFMLFWEIIRTSP